MQTVSILDQDLLLWKDYYILRDMSLPSQRLKFGPIPNRK